MKENQEELDKEMTDAQPEPEIDVERQKIQAFVKLKRKNSNQQN